MLGFFAKLRMLMAILLLSSGVCFAESVLADAVKPAGSMKVLKLQKGDAADLLLINGGAKDGIKNGLSLSLVKDGEVFGNVMVVETSFDKSVALIFGEVPMVNIQEAFVRFNIMK